MGNDENIHIGVKLDVDDKSIKAAEQKIANIDGRKKRLNKDEKTTEQPKSQEEKLAINVKQLGTLVREVTASLRIFKRNIQTVSGPIATLQANVKKASAGSSALGTALRKTTASLGKLDTNATRAGLAVKGLKDKTSGISFREIATSLEKFKSAIPLTKTKQLDANLGKVNRQLVRVEGILRSYKAIRGTETKSRGGVTIASTNAILRGMRKDIKALGPAINRRKDRELADSRRTGGGGSGGGGIGRAGLGGVRRLSSVVNSLDNTLTRVFYGITALFGGVAYGATRAYKDMDKLTQKANALGVSFRWLNDVGKVFEGTGATFAEGISFVDTLADKVASFKTMGSQELNKLLGFTVDVSDPNFGVTSFFDEVLAKWDSLTQLQRVGLAKALNIPPGMVQHMSDWENLLNKAQNTSILDPEDAAKAKELNDALRRISVTFIDLKQKFLAEFSEPLGEFLHDIQLALGLIHDDGSANLEGRKELVQDLVAGAKILLGFMKGVFIVAQLLLDVVVGLAGSFGISGEALAYLIGIIFILLKPLALVLFAITAIANVARGIKELFGGGNKVKVVDEKNLSKSKGILERIKGEAKSIATAFQSVANNTFDNVVKGGAKTESAISRMIAKLPTITTVLTTISNSFAGFIDRVKSLLSSIGSLFSFGFGDEKKETPKREFSKLVEGVERKETNRVLLKGLSGIGGVIGRILTPIGVAIGALSPKEVGDSTIQEGVNPNSIWELGSSIDTIQKKMFEALGSTNELQQGKTLGGDALRNVNNTLNHNPNVSINIDNLDVNNPRQVDELGAKIKEALRDNLADGFQTFATEFEMSVPAVSQ